MSMDELMSRIADRVVAEGDCLLWTGAVSGGRPIMRTKGASTAVRKLIAIIKKQDRPDRVYPSSCNDPMCVAPKHAMAIPKVKHLGMAGKIGGSSGKRSMTAHLTRTDRKLDDSQVNDILNTTDTCGEAALRHGVSRSLISKVRTFKRQAVRSSPFAGLGAR